MKTKIFAAEQRGQKNIGWLISNFTFSFSSYYDPERAGFGLLRTFNDDYVKPEGGFGIHSHVNMEIISILLQGKMNHKDSLGYSEVVEADWVQIMSAGSGLRHEEYNVGDEDVNFLQIWIEPKQQNISPRYQRRSFPAEKRKNQLTTVVSYEEGQAHCWINQNARLMLGYFDADQSVTHSFRPLNMALFLFAIEGTLCVGDQTLNRRDGLGIWDTSELTIDCTTDARFLLMEVPINH
ncbi:pirin family protein [Salmonirosea aquatica]|uniref:Pirin family protein n=1 Tax=Salmonirosea aquatica TaxID=2654236 RepID=A0A7C9BEP0_9BACT|nr:pirin family protein [Cytophagaceae bacterium SJW1-29]